LSFLGQWDPAKCSRGLSTSSQQNSDDGRSRRDKRAALSGELFVDSQSKLSISYEQGRTEWVMQEGVGDKIKSTRGGIGESGLLILIGHLLPIFLNRTCPGLRTPHTPSSLSSQFSKDDDEILIPIHETQFLSSFSFCFFFFFFPFFTFFLISTNPIHRWEEKVKPVLKKALVLLLHALSPSPSFRFTLLLHWLTETATAKLWESPLLDHSRINQSQPRLLFILEIGSFEAVGHFWEKRFHVGKQIMNSELKVTEGI